MKRSIDGFRAMLRGFEYETLEKDKHPIYGLSRDLELIYFNPAWMELAHKNGMSRETLERFGLGTSIIDAIQGQRLKQFYEERYQLALDTMTVWPHEYECSNRNEFQSFQQTAYPLKNGTGLIVIHALNMRFPISRKEYEAVTKKYTQDTGYVTQCSNCRRIQRALEPEYWDWVPSWVSKPPKACSHSICPLCLDYYWKYNYVVQA